MPTFDRMIKDMEATESNGFPTKRNGAGNQQNYIPSGEEGGEYTFDNATFREGDEEEPSGENPSQNKENQNQEENHISVKEGDGKSINKNFEQYVDSQNFRQDFKEQLKRDYALADEDSRTTLEKFISEGHISIVRTSGLDCCQMRGILSISKQSGNENRVPGEVFWHESYHGIDFQSFMNIPEEKMKNFQYSNPLSAAYGLASASASTRYITSSGKTMLETLTEEITNKKRAKTWSDISKDYQADVDIRLKDKYPDLDTQKAGDLHREEIDKLWKQIDSELPELNWGDPQFRERQKARYSRLEQLRSENPTIKRMREFVKDRVAIEHEMFKEWGSISDIYIAGGGSSFCGGHSPSYFRKDKANKVLEFFAEFGSAKATNDKPTLDKFKKYFPETSKAAEEVLEAIYKYSKKGKDA